MKKLLTTLLALATLSTVSAADFTSFQLASTTLTNGHILQTNGSRNRWVATSSLGFPNLLTSNNLWTGTNNYNATSTLFSLITSLIRASSSSGTIFQSNNGTQVAIFGAGGGSNATFDGGVTVTGQTTLANATATDITASGVLFLSGLTSGSIPFIGTGGRVTQNNSNFYWDNTNTRLGVGTSTPQAPLEVYSPSGNVGNMARFSSGYSSGGFVSFFDVANNTTRGYFGYGPTLFTVAAIGDTGFRSQGGFAIGTNGGTVRQYINSSGAFGLGGSITNVSTFAGASLVGNSSGNIGIGTTSPGTSLTVGAGGVNQIPNGAGSNFTPQISNSQTSGVAGISVGVTDGTNNRRASIFVNQTNGLWGLSTTYSSGAIPFVINEAGTERLRIDTSGNVGIATTTPSERLQVEGNIRLLASGVDQGLFGRSSDASHRFSLTRQQFTGGASGDLSISAFAGIGLTGGKTAGQETSAPHMYITSTGNVGIGTTNPSAKLTVGGSSGAVNGTFLVQASTNSEWFSVGTAGNGVVQFNTAGGSTRAGGVDLGARFNITPINDSMPTLAVRGYSGGTSDIIRVSSPSATSGDYLIVKSGGNVGIGTTTPTSLLTVASSTQSTSYSILGVFNALATPVMNILGSGAVLFGTATTANCGTAPCGLTVATTTQFTAGTVARVVGYASAASTTINLNTTDVATTTIDRATTFVNPTGTAYDGAMFEIRAKATTTQTVYWDTVFASSTDLTNVSSVASGTTRFLFEYRQDVGKWELVGKLGGYIN